MRMLLIGPPGAGKGTQGERVAKSYGIPAVATGDIFRRNVAEGTPLGVKAKEYMDRGAYVPDDLTNALVLDRLTQDDVTGGFLLDGFPRTLAQVETLDTCLDGQGSTLDVVVQLVADDDEVVERLLRRAVEQHRSDDTEDVIRHRLEVYRQQTHPLVEVYAQRGILYSVDAIGTLDEVTDRILTALGGGIQKAG